MPVIVVTRLGQRAESLFNDSFAAAVALLEQARTSVGSLGADALAEAHNTRWNCSSAWQNRASMRAFVETGAHTGSRARPDDWCDEAAFSDREEQSADVPDWQSEYRHLVRQGPGATPSHLADANSDRTFPAPAQNG